MISRNELKVVEVYELFNEKRYRIRVEGTNIVINVSATSEEEALRKALSILAQANLDRDSLERIRSILAEKLKNQQSS
ncbi:MAG: hypothetical protein QXX15_02165 [Desulfurococcaceae archaeon]